MPTSSSSPQRDTGNHYVETSTPKDNETIHNPFSVLVCGPAKLDHAELVDILHVQGHLGRRKLTGLVENDLSEVVNSDVLWMTPKKHWFADKKQQCGQDVFLHLVDAYIANGKDVVIIAPKDYVWKNQDPGTYLFVHAVNNHVVLCTRKLDTSLLLSKSDDEQFFTVSLAKELQICRTTSDRVGVRQSQSIVQKGGCEPRLKTTDQATRDNKKQMYQSNNKTTSQQKLQTAPTHDKKQQKQRGSNKQKQKQTSSSDRKRRDTKTEDEDYDLGDHTTNDDKPTNKPNYAKEHLKKKQVGKTVEKGTDDCGDDVSAIDIDDNAPLAAFVDMFLSYQASYHSDLKEEVEENQKMFFSNMHDLLDFVENTPHAFYNSKSRMHVMEIFAGYGGVTRIAIRRGLSVGQAFDLNVGIDLTNINEKNKLIRYVLTYKPEVVVMGPPCTAFSGWARYNMIHASEAWSKSYATGYPLAILSAQIAKLQLDAGRHFLAENPWSSTIWYLPAWQAILHRCYVAYCEQCAFGLFDAAGEPTLKPTAFVSSCEI